MAETTEIRLPRLADSVTTVKFGAWLKEEGDRVEAGEPVAEVETDKTTVELEAPAAGVLCDLRVAPGVDGLEAGAVLGRIAPAGGESDGAAPVPPSAAATVEPEGEAPGAAGEAPVAPAADAPAVRDQSPAVTGEAPAATPLALRMVAAAGLDLSAVRAADADGRIRKADVDRVLAERRGTPGDRDAPSAQLARSGEEAAAGAGAPSGDGASFVNGASFGDGAPSGDGGEPFAAAPVGPASSSAPSASPAEAGASGGAEAPHHDTPLTAMRRVTATRMQQAKQTVPHFYLRTECRVDGALRLLAAAKRRFPDAPPTLTDLVVRAAASALRAVPDANSAWVDGAVRVYERVDVAVAVATQQGLVAPVVRGADGMDLGAIARETRALAARARDGRLAPAEYAGGTFTISNLGMYDVESLYAIVNPPQSCILGVGAATRRPVAAGDGVGIGSVMACTLSADHRVIDGAVGAELLRAIKSRLEQPGLMLLEAGALPAGDRGGPP